MRRRGRRGRRGGARGEECGRGDELLRRRCFSSLPLGLGDSGSSSSRSRGRVALVFLLRRFAPLARGRRRGAPRHPRQRLPQGLVFGTCHEPGLARERQLDRQVRLRGQRADDGGLLDLWGGDRVFRPSSSFLVSCCCCCIDVAAEVVVDLCLQLKSGESREKRGVELDEG